MCELDVLIKRCLALATLLSLSMLEFTIKPSFYRLYTEFLEKFNRNDGDFLGKRDLGSSFFSSPTAANDTIGDYFFGLVFPCDYTFFFFFFFFFLFSRVYSIVASSTFYPRRAESIHRNGLFLPGNVCKTGRSTIRIVHPSLSLSLSAPVSSLSLSYPG